MTIEQGAELLVIAQLVAQRILFFGLSFCILLTSILCVLLQRSKP